jgi:hypothetical protein
MKDFRLSKPAIIFVLAFMLLSVIMYFINGSRLYRLFPIALLIAAIYNVLEVKFFKGKK